MHITITNIMQIESLDLDLTASLNIIAGVNEAGKSSIRDAILWGFTGQARELKTHKEQASLIREGAKVGEVTISLDGQHAFTRRKTLGSPSSLLGEIPDIGLSPAILFDPYTYLAMPEAQRRELMFKVIPGLNPTGSNIFDRLFCWPGIDAIVPMPTKPEEETEQVDIIRSIAKMAASHGFPGAEKEAVENRKVAKRVRDEYKGAVEPVKILTIDGKDYNIPTLNLEAIKITLAELQKEKDNLLRQKGAAEAMVKRIEKVKGQLEGITIPNLPHPDEIPTLQQRLQTVKNDIEANAQETIKAAVKNQTFPATCPAITLEEIACPKAGKKVGAEPPAAEVLEALTQNRQGLLRAQGEIEKAIQEANSRIQIHQAAVDRKKNLEDDLIRLQAEPEASIPDLDEQITARQTRIDRGRAFNQAIHDYNSALARYQEDQSKLAAAEQEIIIYDALAKALASDGIPSQMIAEVLDEINELLDEAAGHLFPGRYLHLTGELNIVLQNSPYVTLSKSAKYRVGVAFQYALARLTGARVLLVDEADILDDNHRVSLIDFLLAHMEHFDQVIIFMTNEAPWISSQENQFQSWWLEGGQIKKVA